MLKKLSFAFSELGLKKMIMLLFCVLLICSVTFVSWFLFFMLGGAIVKEGKENISQGLSQVNRNIVYSLNFYQEILYHLCISDNLQEKLRKEIESDADKIVTLREIYKLIQPLKNSNTSIWKIEIFPENRDLIDNDVLLDKNNPWYIKMAENPPNHTSVKFCKQLRFNVNGLEVAQDVIQISNQIYDSQQRKMLGIIRVYVAMNEVASLFDGFNDTNGTSMIMMDETRNIVYQSKNYQDWMLTLLNDECFEGVRQEFSIKKDRQQWWILSRPQYRSNMYIMTFVNVDTLKKSITNFTPLFTVVMMVMLVLGILISYLLAKKITSGFDNLVHKVRKISDSDLGVEINNGVNYPGEVGFLYSRFASIVKENNLLAVDVYNEKIARRDNEIRLLQSQIDSHFLYNTLSSINWMAINISAFDISRAVNALAKYYRLILSKGKEFITVSDELEHVKSYIMLQKIRFKERFCSEFDISDSVKGYSVPKVIIQPFVENAIIHGFCDIDYQGKILIAAHEKNGCLEFVVEDNGRGLSEEKIKELSTLKSESTGYGIRHVDEKIKLLYGGNFGVSLAIGQLGGLRAVIRFPASVNNGKQRGDSHAI